MQRAAKCERSLHLTRELWSAPRFERRSHLIPLQVDSCVRLAMDSPDHHRMLRIPMVYGAMALAMAGAVSGQRPSERSRLQPFAAGAFGVGAGTEGYAGDAALDVGLESKSRGRVGLTAVKAGFVNFDHNVSLRMLGVTSALTLTAGGRGEAHLGFGLTRRISTFCCPTRDISDGTAVVLGWGIVGLAHPLAIRASIDAIAETSTGHGYQRMAVALLHVGVLLH